MSAGVQDVVYLVNYHDEDRATFLRENNQDGKIFFRQFYEGSFEEADPTEFLQGLCAP